MSTMPLFSDDYLLACWEPEFKQFVASGEDQKLLQRLQNWAWRDTSRTETQLQGLFVETFFVGTWGYWGTGQRSPEDGFCLDAQHGVRDAGQTGGKGSADLALGWFGKEGVPPIPQVLCEFKDIRSGLDSPQARKGNDRSPVKQCFDYLRHAFDQTDARSTVLPTWGIVTDMNEFRLYARRVGDSQCQRFIVRASPAAGVSLIDNTDEARFQRFLFWKLFQRSMLLTISGKTPLERVMEEQWVQEKALERDFYREYQSFRETVFASILQANPRFHATRGRLVRLTQRFLDRCIFVLFCEDMGKALDFPTNLLRDMLVTRSQDMYYDPDGSDIWDLVRRLFRTLRDGGVFPPEHSINRFNGGLFEDLPDLEALRIPNRVFCARGQGQSLESLLAHKNTLLFFSANYNFGAHGTGRERAITLYSLGRIFEQSITDLEYMEAEADGRQSIAALTKRKRDGVYYTPEWVTAYLVKETVGARLRDIRDEIGLTPKNRPSEDAIEKYRQFLHDGRKTASEAANYVTKLNDYRTRLEKLKVVDPACGSGAFLIQTLEFLAAERRWITDERVRVTGQEEIFDHDRVTRNILVNNIYGVDINPESVEITQLALWLHTALPGKPLCSLDAHIRCGNSLVGPDFREFYRDQQGALFDDLDEGHREEVNVFDWVAAFPEAFGPSVSEAERGFDCVVGNPPYVKLQHFRKLKPTESTYYTGARTANGSPLYESAQTGNFDLYLPFIEKGVSLLNRAGHMGFIAPNVWLKNEYGRGLRTKVKRLRCLDRWVDFGSFQVFEEATTYTALQFYSGSPCASLRFVHAPCGDISSIDWDGEVDSISYDELPVEGAWVLPTRREHDLLARLAVKCKPLAESCAGITVGIQTSADWCYHLRRVAPGRYRQMGAKADGIEYEIEDTIMHPLVSGPEAKRYQRPATHTYLLFPYAVENARARLISAAELQSGYPKAWAYLRRFEAQLRARERGLFDDNEWFRFGRNQNIDKQEFPKLLVPRLVTHLFAVADPAGEFYLDNVDVGGVIPANAIDLWFLCGVLNSPVCDFVFRRISKPFRGETFSANKQFIAPLPIPPATDEEKAKVGEGAKRLQELHTARRDAIAELQRRLESPQCEDDIRDEGWLWADVKPVANWKTHAPEGYKGRALTAWAKDQRESYLKAHLEAIDALLVPGTSLSVENSEGEVCFLAGGVPAVSVFLAEPEASFVTAQWRQVARSTHVTENFDARRLLRLLLSLRRTGNDHLRDQVIALDSRIVSLDAEIATAEREMNALIYRLYDLSPDEIRMVGAG